MPISALLVTKWPLMERLLPSTKQATCTSPSRHDKLFRQAAARNKQQTLHWDTLKEDLLVWCVTNPPFRTRPQSHTNPQIRTSTGASVLQGATTGSSHHSSEHTTHTPSGHEEICPRFNFGKCSEGTECAFSHMCWVTGCGGDHPAKACTRATLGAT